MPGGEPGQSDLKKADLHIFDETNRLPTNPTPEINARQNVRPSRFKALKHSSRQPTQPT
jgi:hypothetical protein